MDGKALSGFQNSSYFILPLKINDHDKFAAYLRNHSTCEGDKVTWKWKEEPSGFKTQYLMYYASKMNEPADNRFRCFIYEGKTKPNIYMFDDKISNPDKRPELGDISLYVFGQEIIFLEFQVLYKEMEIKDIANFVNTFRSLRNGKPESVVSEARSLKDTAEGLLPAGESGTILCFSNPSEIKMQANIFTMLGVPKGMLTLPKDVTATPEQIDLAYRKQCGRIAHGYNTTSTNDDDAVSDYDRCLHLNNSEYWGICPDGIAYIRKYKKESISTNVYSYLCNDYHFLYLLLLHQRFSAVSFIEEISRIGKTDKEREKITEIYPNVVDLRTSYSFRVISDEFFVQTVYSTAYQVLEIDALFHDLEDANGQFNELSKEREKRVEGFVRALSLLAAFSAVTDLAAYLCDFTSEMPFLVLKLLSLGVVLLILVGAYIKYYRPKQR